jgi:hypothetical protein
LGTTDGGDWDDPPDQLAENRERERDAQALQFSGPALVIAGTLLNGFSGFFPSP